MDRAGGPNDRKNEQIQQIKKLISKGESDIAENDVTETTFPDGQSGGNFSADVELYYCQIYSLLLDQVVRILNYHADTLSKQVGTPQAQAALIVKNELSKMQDSIHIIISTLRTGIIPELNAICNYLYLIFGQNAPSQLDVQADLSTAQTKILEVQVFVAQNVLPLEIFTPPSNILKAIVAINELTGALSGLSPFENLSLKFIPFPSGIQPSESASSVSAINQMIQTIQNNKVTSSCEDFSGLGSGYVGTTLEDAMNIINTVFVPFLNTKLVQFLVGGVVLLPVQDESQVVNVLNFIVLFLNGDNEWNKSPLLSLLITAPLLEI